MRYSVTVFIVKANSHLSLPFLSPPHKTYRRMICQGLEKQVQCMATGLRTIANISIVHQLTCSQALLIMLNHILTHILYLYQGHNLWCKDICTNMSKSYRCSKYCTPGHNSPDSVTLATFQGGISLIHTHTHACVHTHTHTRIHTHTHTHM